MSDTPKQSTNTNNVYLSPASLARKTEIPLPTIRMWLFHRDTNGLKRAVRRINRKLLISLEEWEKWVESHSEGCSDG